MEMIFYLTRLILLTRVTRKVGLKLERKKTGTIIIHHTQRNDFPKSCFRVCCQSGKEHILERLSNPSRQMMDRRYPRCCLLQVFELVAVSFCMHSMRQFSFLYVVFQNRPGQRLYMKILNLPRIYCSSFGKSWKCLQLSILIASWPFPCIQRAGSREEILWLVCM